MDKLIVGIGEILWDMLPEGKKLGGAPANFAYHAGQSGLNSCVVSAIGNDNAGREILKHLKMKKLNYSIRQTDYPTGSVLVHLDEAGIPCYEIQQQVAWDNVAYTPELEEIAARTNAVCFGTLAQREEVSRVTINRFLDRMPDGDKQYKIFDINLRQHFYNREILAQSFRRCNILKLNDEELVIIRNMFGYKQTDTQAICNALRSDYDLKIVILTCGVNGSYVFTCEGNSFYETPRIQVRDTVGAGDSFTATFCAALLKNRNLREAHRLAVEVSAYVCTQDGAMPPLPDHLKY